tara:strand:- start:5887 stop:6390 length:504 start_codon:yes stop_codon:yes gene_type:complete
MEMTLNDNLDIIKEHQATTPVHVIPLASKFGIDVFKVPVDNDNFSGMIRKNDDGKYDIYVNASHSPSRRRFTIAHELAHYILHRVQIGDGITDDALYRSGLSNYIESEANQLAADILMPRHLLQKYMDEGINSVPELAKIFEVSPSAMSIRLGVPYETESSQRMASI